MIVFAVLATVSLIIGGDEPMSSRSALSPLVAIFGAPVGIGFVVVGVAKLRHGHR